MSRFFSLWAIIFLTFNYSPFAKTVCPRCGAMFTGDPVTCEYDSTPVEEWLELVDIPGGLFQMGSGGENLPANGYRLFDMAGNASEWCSDYYNEEYYAISPDKNPEGPATGMFRVTRGGSWGDGRSGLRCRARAKKLPDVRDSRVGFRAAAD